MVGGPRRCQIRITQTENPTSGQEFVKSLTKSVVPALSKAGLIPPAANARNGAPRSTALLVP